MTLHDIAMFRISQYWRRAFRSGYAFAAVRDRFKKTSSFWVQEFRRIVIRGGGFLFLTSLSVLALTLLPKCWQFSLLIIGTFLVGQLLLIFPRLFRVSYFQSEKDLTRAQAKIYAWHCSLVVVPDFFGVLRYTFGKIFSQPLRNKIRTIGVTITPSGV